jgi:hypothetical protein
VRIAHAESLVGVQSSRGEGARQFAGWGAADTATKLTRGGGGEPRWQSQEGGAASVVAVIVAQVWMCRR